MASQLRLQVVLPIAVLGLLGLGVGAFAFGKPPTAADPDAVAANIANRTATTTEAAQPVQPVQPKPKTPLERALAKDKAVVVLFYTPAASYDTLQTREARAGAQAGGAGFLALDVTRDRKTAALATSYDVRDAPAILVFARGPRVAVRLDGYADRDTIEEAALIAR
ncbi:MAG: hypothetical protein WD027_06270 [Gaiellales bacterium]